MMDDKKMQRIRDLEKQREAGKSVPELDALYEQADQKSNRGYDAATGATPAPAPKMPPKKMAKGGMTNKQMYDSMTTPPTKPSMGATKKPMDMADKMFGSGAAPKKMASGGATRGDGCASRGKTKGRTV